MDIHVPEWRAIITMAPEFKPGDPPPKGFLDRFEWAQIQMDAGLKQVRCFRCSLWRFPQEIARTGTATLPDRHGRPVTVKTHTCNDCETKPGEGD